MRLMLSPDEIARAQDLADDLRALLRLSPAQALDHATVAQREIAALTPPEARADVMSYLATLEWCYLCAYVGVPYGVYESYTMH